MKTSKYNNMMNFLRRNSKKNIFFTCIAIFFSIALMGFTEYALRLSKKYANYYEINEEKWDPARTNEILAEPWLWKNPKNETRIIKKKEYRQVFYFGSDSFIGEALPPIIKKGDCRVIVVGDSFVQGFGDGENMGLVNRIKKLLNNSPKLAKSLSIMNAGVGGSDPVFEKELISRVLLNYKPNYILLFLNYSDIQDLKRRGGLDRFTSEGQLKMRSTRWAWLYNQSHLFRALTARIFNYESDFMSASERGTNEQIAADGVIDAVSGIHEMANQNSFKLIVFFHPMQFELKSGGLSAPLVRVKQGLIKKGVDVVDLTNYFLKKISGQPASDYFWEKDGHYNPKGYFIFASAVESELIGQALRPGTFLKNFCK